MARTTTLMRTTTQLRALWDPPCSGPWARVELYGEGVVTVRASVVDAVRALDSCLVRHGYETRKADTGAYVCRAITGGTGYSLHAYGIALDINWQTNPYGPTLVTDMPAAMVAAIKAIRTRSGARVWRWGGDFINNKDAMHFEIVASPAEIASGIDPASLPAIVEVVVAADLAWTIDSLVDDGNGTAYVAGWIFDPGAPEQSVAIHFHGWDAGHGPEITALQADLPSPDVNQTFGIGGAHRFAGTLKVPRVRREPTFIIYGGDVQTGMVELARRTVAVMR